jgi:hypothetical protein
LLCFVVSNTMGAKASILKKTNNYGGQFIESVSSDQLDYSINMRGITAVFSKLRIKEDALISLGLPFRVDCTLESVSIEFPFRCKTEPTRLKIGNVSCVVTPWFEGRRIWDLAHAEKVIKDKLLQGIDRLVRPKQHRASTIDSDTTSFIEGILGSVVANLTVRALRCSEHTRGTPALYTRLHALDSLYRSTLAP